AMRKELQHAGHRIGAVDRALRAANQFDARDVVGGQIGEVVRSSGLVHRNAVNQDLRVIGFAAAYEERSYAASTSCLRNGHSGRKPQRVEQVDPLSQLQFV